MRRFRIPVLLLAVLLLFYALVQNRTGYALLPNAAALFGVILALFVLRASGGSGGGR